MNKLIFSILFVLLVSLVDAHQPKLVGSNTVQVIDPEISKAYYGELSGVPHYYTIESEKEFRIYVNVLIPGKVLTHTISAELSGDDVFYELNGDNFSWALFYEEFGKDHYLKGPELGEDFKGNQILPAGTYVIRVFNDENKGKYVLAIGDIESFPIGEILIASITVPYLKVSFFGKYYLLFIPIILIGLIVYVVKRKWKRK